MSSEPCHSSEHSWEPIANSPGNYRCKTCDVVGRKNVNFQVKDYPVNQGIHADSVVAYRCEARNCSELAVDITDDPEYPCPRCGEHRGEIEHHIGCPVDFDGRVKI